MSASCKFERSVLGHDEFETILVTHHPEIYDLNDTDLRDIQVRLRKMRDRERTLARQKRREARGKADPRGGSFPGTAEKPQERKQIFTAALKRVNKELKRQRMLEARTTNVEAARRALALRRAANFVHHPAAGDTSNGGVRPLANRRWRTRVSPAKIGSISQATKVAQAVRDSKN
jgi:hypothetical protein